MEPEKEEEEEESKSKAVQRQLHEQQLQVVWSWGAGTEGQLGTGKVEDEHVPQLLNLPLSLSSSISSLSCGGAHVLALTSCGRVFTWGRGTSGQLGHGEMANAINPMPVSSLESYFITHSSAGWNHSGFVTDSGHLFTCGDGFFGQLGHGDYKSHSSPVKVSYFLDNHIEQIACGMRHSLVLLKGGKGNQVYGFGSGKRGQLGISKDRIKSVCVPQVTSGFEDVEIAKIYANGDHSAAFSADGHLFTWGRGFKSSADAPYPERLHSSLSFTEAAVGWNHALLLTVNKEVFMLGGNRHGVLGDPEKTSSASHLADKALNANFPADLSEADIQKVPGIDGIKILQVAAGAEHSALVTEDGVIKTWGWGEHGQLGLGDTDDQTHPQVVNLGYGDQEKDTLYRIYCGSGFTYVLRST